MKLVRIHYHSSGRERITECLYDIHPELLAIYEELGIIELEGNHIGGEELRRLKRILRLKENCGVNTVGASIIVDLLDRIENLQDELSRLRKGR